LTNEIQRLDVAAVEQDVQGLVNQAVELLRSFSELVAQHIAGFDAQIEEIERKLREEIAADASKQKIADLRMNAEKRLRHATGLRDDYLKAWVALQAYWMSARRSPINWWKSKTRSRVSVQSIT
jgi:hypothetical protein